MSQRQLTRFRKYREGRPFLSRAQRLAGGVILAVLMALLAAPAHPPFPPPQTQEEIAPLQSAGDLQITLSPTLSPAFDPNITDYVVPDSPGLSTQISVNAPKNTKVSIDGQPFRKLAFTTQVNLTPGQSFSFVVNSLAGSRTYYVRCLPSDFPAWTTERLGTPQAAYYVFAPNLSFSAGARRYIILADNYGVPLWWYRSVNSPIDAKLLPNGNIAWTSPPDGEERMLDGSLVHTFTAAGQLGGTINNHELLLLPNGNYVYIADVTRGPVDLRPYGGSETGVVDDNVIEEFAPDGSLVWSWSAMDHIPVSETALPWQGFYVGYLSPADPYHMNSVEPDGDGYVVSLRHLNAVIRIDKASGSLTWKLGGIPRPESLTFVGDAYGNFGGQHDARILPDGTLTLHDNGSLLGRAPRAARYSIDPANRTATSVEQVAEANAPPSDCCGSARRLSGGNWVMSWGSIPYVTELAPDGSRVLRMTLLNSYFSYRAAPIPPGVLRREALRSGMDAQYPR